ncbi:MAG: sodium:solute symporter family protein [Deltaproteobacteria bacterium]|nr:sodium:solute symporter family protein [Deltaproteobacteria bacterium]MBW2413492.1 sodium:solute symporter family protein [Deltaproteobacteria bacterium]
MSLEYLGVAGLAVYLVALLVVAELARRARRDQSPADHFLAGRDLGVFVLFLTLYATAYSGNSLLGYPGEAYRRGFSWIMATGFMLSIVVCFHALVPRLRPIAVAHAFVTPGDWVRHRFAGEPGARALLAGVSVLMTLALANFLFAQLKAMGEMADQVTGGVVSYEFGVFGLALVILVYETVGGMRAVAWTDAAQGVLMLLGLAALLNWVLGASGGLELMTTQILEIRPAAALVPDARECANWVSTIGLLGLASIVYPQAIQRIYAARSGPVLKRSLAMMSFMPLATTAVVTLIGLAAIPRFADLGAAEADRVMPLLLGEWAAASPLYAVAAVAVFIGALAAIMSTADSVLLSLGSLVAEDLLGRPRDDASTTALGKKVAAWTMLAMACGAMFREITLWRLIELKMELLIQCVPAFLLAIHWRGLRARPTFAGLVAGAAVAIVGVLAGWKRIGGVHIGMLSLCLNLAIAVAGSIWARPRRSEPVRPSAGLG